MTPAVAAIAVRVTEFWSNVDRRNDKEACWLWTGYVNEDGYGEFFIDGKMQGAHELAVTFTTGEVRPAALDTCHSCDNPPCCNPAHVRFGTRRSNVHEMHERGRAARAGRLSNDQVVEIRLRRESGARQQDLADQYAVSEAQINLIVRGIRWPNVGGPIQQRRSFRARMSKEK